MKGLGFAIELMPMGEELTLSKSVTFITCIAFIIRRKIIKFKVNLTITFDKYKLRNMYPDVEAWQKKGWVLKKGLPDIQW